VTAPCVEGREMERSLGSRLSAQWGTTWTQQLTDWKLGLSELEPWPCGPARGCNSLHECHMDVCFSLLLTWASDGSDSWSLPLPTLLWFLPICSPSSRLWVCMCMRVCVCVCVCERERERERLRFLSSTNYLPITCLGCCAARRDHRSGLSL
jgi:hypothetical protein